MTNAAVPNSRTPRNAGVLTGAGIAAAAAGIVASSCCVLPIVLVGLGLGSAGAALIPALSVLRPFLLAAAALAVVLAWLSHLRRPRACAADSACAPERSSTRLRLWLILASVIVVTSFAWQALIEPRVLTWIR